MKEIIYESPQVEILEVSVEKGFALSFSSSPADDSDVL
jgi:hypothetical protein